MGDSPETIRRQIEFKRSEVNAMVSRQHDLAEKYNSTARCVGLAEAELVRLVEQLDQAEIDQALAELPPVAADRRSTRWELLKLARYLSEPQGHWRHNYSVSRRDQVLRLLIGAALSLPVVGGPQLDEAVDPHQFIDRYLSKLEELGR